MENTPNTIARIVIPSSIDETKKKELLHTLGEISNDDIERIGVAIEETERKREEEERRKEEEKKNRKIYAAQELKDYRKEWKEKIVVISDTSKEKIIQAAENIPVKVDKDEDGSRLIEFKLGGKTRKILDPKLKTHSDGAYSCIIKGNEGGEQVATRGMRGYNIDEWKNQKLKEYVHEKMEKGLHVPGNDICLILQELGNLADLSEGSEQIAMFMYLTGMDGHYYLRPGNYELICSYASRYFYPCEKTHDSYSKIFMISVSEE